MNKLLFWLRDHAPTFCYCCQGLFFKKDMIYHESLYQGWYPLCKACDEIIFRPFSKS